MNVRVDMAACLVDILSGDEVAGGARLAAHGVILPEREGFEVVEEAHDSDPESDLD